MKKWILALLIFPVLSVAAEHIKSDIPVAVNSVTTQRVGENLIRVIQYNTEITPKFSVELIKPPKMTLEQKIEIKEIQVDIEGSNKLLKFSGTAGVFIAGVKVENDEVKFDVEYFGAGQAGGYYLSSCKISLSNNRLVGPTCRLVSTEIKK